MPQPLNVTYCHGIFSDIPTSKGLHKVYKKAALLPILL